MIAHVAQSGEDRGRVVLHLRSAHPSTVAVEAASRMLFITSALSRLIGANMPPWVRVGARQANSVKPSPAVTSKTISVEAALRSGSI